jgi:ATP-binding cassette subfamily F protein uup
VFDVVAAGLGELGTLLARYHHLLHDGDVPDMDALGEVQAAHRGRPRLGLKRG